MKKYAMMLAGMALLVGGPVLADEMKHSNAMCTKHCNIMDLEKKVEALKSQAASADKTATIESYLLTNKINFKKIADIQKLIAYYNGLN